MSVLVAIAAFIVAIWAAQLLGIGALMCLDRSLQLWVRGMFVAAGLVMSYVWVALYQYSGFPGAAMTGALLVVLLAITACVLVASASWRKVFVPASWL